MIKPKPLHKDNLDWIKARRWGARIHDEPGFEIWEWNGHLYYYETEDTAMTCTKCEKTVEIKREQDVNGCGIWTIECCGSKHADAGFQDLIEKATKGAFPDFKIISPVLAPSESMDKPVETQ